MVQPVGRRLHRARRGAIGSVLVLASVAVAGAFGLRSANALTGTNNSANNGTNSNPNNSSNSGNTTGNGTTGTTAHPGGVTTTTAGNPNGRSSGGEGTTSGTSTTTTASPSVVATLTSTGDGVVVHASDGTTVTGYQGEPLRLGSTVTASGQPGHSAGANPATIQWAAGGLSQLYDAKPSQFVAGSGFAGPVQTQIRIDAPPPENRAVSLTSGFLRFWFPTGTKHYRFEAVTDTVVAAVNGTDFTVGYDPSARTSAVFVTQDSVSITPANPSLHPFPLSSGNQVEVTANQVGPITGLGGPAPRASGQQSTSGSGSSTTRIIEVVIGVLALSAILVLVLAYRHERARRRRPISAPADGPQSGPPAEETKPPAASPAPTQPMAPSGPWSPTHRAPEGGMACWASPEVAGPLVATLDSGVEVRVTEHQSHWAHIVCANGWTTWVDSRLLLTNGVQEDKGRS